MEIGLWGVFLVALIIGFSGAMPLGSMFTMVVNHNLRRGLVAFYWILWWLTGGVALLAGAYKYGVTGSIVFFTGHILADLIWYSFISYLVSGGKRFLNQRVFNGLLGACGIFLMFFAVKFLLEGWNLLVKL